jgi:hypothetical protein
VRQRNKLPVDDNPLLSDAAQVGYVNWPMSSSLQKPVRGPRAQEQRDLQLLQDRHSQFGRSAPAGVIVLPDTARIVIWQRRSASQFVSPEGVVGRVDDAILVLVAEKSDCEKTAEYDLIQS